MNDWVALNSQETELFMLTIETSIRITKRFQFFLWAQGTLQRFLPHETLLCARGDMVQQRCRHEIYSRAVLDEESKAVLCGPVFGLGPMLLREWKDLGYGSRLVNQDASLSGPLLQRIGLASVLCAGVSGVGSEYGSFFAFLSREPYSARQTYFVELLMPYLHVALSRISESEDANEPAELPIDAVLSPRERQVLDWMREGKTNHEIGHILCISPLTVKNHVQNILRKLKVCNRAQAVATGVRAGLFSVDFTDLGLPPPVTFSEPTEG